MDLKDRLQHAWNAFMNRDPTGGGYYRSYGDSYSDRPDRRRSTVRSERTIVESIKNRIALDCAAITINHCKMDEDGRFLEVINSGLNTCLNLEANLDQTGRAFIFDLVYSMLDEGVIAALPIDTTLNPNVTGSYDILSMRTGKVLTWKPKDVLVNVYNENTGRRQDLLFPKSQAALIENPFYAIMNEPNSTMQRLIRKLNLLDSVDEQASSGKMDLIIQLPYSIKSEARKKEAEAKRKDVEMQLSGSKYGIAYIDATEKITQLNRPLENNLLKQIEYLTNLAFSQLGITQSILDGTADEQTMLNYNNRVIEPIVSAIVDEFKRKFLTKTARTQHQSIEFFRDPFRLVPVNQMAEIADKFTRNEIMTSNEIRQEIGMKPSKDPKADQLVNSNISQPNNGEAIPPTETPEGGEVEPNSDNSAEQDTIVHDLLSNLESQIDQIITDYISDDSEEEE